MQFRRVGEQEWTTLTGLIGHSPEKLSYTTTRTDDRGKRAVYSEETTSYDRMVFYFQNGTVRTVAQWSQCEIMLGEDWVAYMGEKRRSNYPTTE